MYLMSAERTTIKVLIPHPDEKGCPIVGVLEQLAFEQPTQGRRIALLLHGTLGHKDYLFFKPLVTKLPIDSFRFDFRGNNETPGSWTYGGLDRDIADITAVVDYLNSTYGYVVELLIGHSRGSITAFRWLSVSEKGRTVSSFVNVSGRYRMSKIWDGPIGKTWKAAFDSQGYYDWKLKVAGKETVVKIYPQDIEAFAAWDSSAVWGKFPQHTDVLTLHGLADVFVPPYDALIYARALGDRSPGTHTLHLVEGADHNFTSMHEEVVETVLAWWRQRENGTPKTGLWMTGVRGRL